MPLMNSFDPAVFGSQWVLPLLMLMGVYFLVRIAGKFSSFAGVFRSSGPLWKWLDRMCIVLVLLLALYVATFCGGTQCGGNAPQRNRTSAYHRAIMSALENYRSDYGEYPSPKAPDVRAALNGQDYDMSGALMLYQALSGDGDDHIRSANGGHVASDGKVSEAELKNVFLKEMPKEMVLKTDAGYILADGFGHPFQYTLGGVDSVNETYDVWSFAEDPPPAKVDKTAKQAEAISGKWIKNW